MKKKILIGKELVRANIITPKQLKFALKEQRKLQGKKKERIGEMVIKYGFVTEEQMIKFLEKHLKIPYVKLDANTRIDPKAVRLIPERMARNFKAIGIKVSKDKLQVAMADPFDIIAVDTLETRTKHGIDRWFSLPREVEAAINKYYPIEEGFEGSIGEFISLRAEEARNQPQDFAKRLDYKQLESEATKAPVVRFVNKLIEEAFHERASDIHIEPQEKELSIRYRIDGVLREVVPPPKEMESAIITRIKLLGGMDIAERRLPQDGRFKCSIKGTEIDIRLASSPIIYGEKLVLRILDKSSLFVDMQNLGLTEDELKTFRHILKQPYGMILVTGPTGSGKTTTLYSALNYINESKKNIVTIEDPVEYQLKGINQIQIKPHIGLTFASSLRTVLRQDPDIIMIGEIRDLETLENAVKASLTGHLVISTIHTNDAPGVVFRLIHMGLEPYLIIACLNLVIAQRLIRRICEKCKEKITMSESTIKGMERRLGMNLSGINFYKGKGCTECDDTGYRGRVGIFEVLPIDEDIKALILDGASEKELKKVILKTGMKNLFARGIEKVRQGAPTIEEVLKVTFIEKGL